MDHKKCLEKLRRYQESERDSRERARESEAFIYEKDGQWEEKALKFFPDRPRYQFDHTYPIRSAIANELKETEFGMQVVEAGNGSKPEIAETYDGMLRGIQTLSNMRLVMPDTIDSIVDCGFDAWEVFTDWVDSDAFEQDILITRVHDGINRVWVGPSEKPDMSDVLDGFKITKISIEEYEKEYPEGSKQSIGSDDNLSDWRDTDGDDIAVVDYYYLKAKKTDLHLLSNNMVVSEQDWPKMQSQFPGVEIVRSRSRMVNTCYIQRMDAGGWLDKAKETPFSFIPLICGFANYKNKGGRRIFFGAVEKLKDAQRVYNYAGSREVADGALAPVEKIVMTPAQGEGFEDQNSRLNSSNDPVMYVNPDPQAQSPVTKLPGNQPNMGLAQTRASAAQDMVTISSQYEPARGEGLSNTSGKAYEILQQKSNLSAGPFKQAIQRMVHLCARIAIDAIPKVYDTRDRQVRLVNEDGTSKFESVNQEMLGADGKLETVRDLGQGKYDVAVNIGRVFSNRKSEGVKALVESLGPHVPEVLAEGADILIKAMDAPYLDQIAERVRKKKIDAGDIPESQLTDEERQKIMQDMERAAAQQQPDPMQEATIAAIMAQVQQAQVDAMKTQQDMEIAMTEQMRKMQETQAKILEMNARTVEALTRSETDYNMPGNSANEAAERVSRGMS